MTGRREVWITGVGLLTCLGEGPEAAWSRLESGAPPPYDDKSFAPYIVHPLTSASSSTLVVVTPVGSATVCSSCFLS